MDKIKSNPTFFVPVREAFSLGYTLQQTKKIYHNFCFMPTLNIEMAKNDSIMYFEE